MKIGCVFVLIVLNIFFFRPNIAKSQTDPPVTQSQINQPDGVAGLDAGANVILGVSSDTSKTRSVHFHPGNANLNNNDVYIWCDTGGGADVQGHCHMDNLKYGNTWEVNNKIIVPTVSSSVVSAQSALNIGLDDTSSPDGSGNPRIQFPNSVDGYVAAYTFMAGGHSTNDYVFSKWTCFNVSGGDQGGVCQNFGDYTGYEGNHRNGAGVQDGINLSSETDNSSSIDVIGGGQKSADGTIYTVSYTASGVVITPSLSSKEKTLLRYQMRLWTNMTNGTFGTVSSDTNPDHRGTQVPNYYLGYWNGAENDTATNSTLTVTTDWVQGAPAANFGWFLTNSQTDTSYPAAALAPGSNSGDVIDTGLSGIDAAHNSQMSSNAIFLGGPDQVFNNYTLERYSPNNRSFVSSYDNEHDHWMLTTAENQVVSRGETYSWGGSNAHLLASGSYMMRLAGFNVQPIGLWVGGIYPGGYLLKSDDAFFNLSFQGAMSSTIGSSQLASGLGQAVGANGNWGRLGYYSSQDGSSNPSYHLGMSKSGGSQGGNDTVDCGGNCTEQGQIVYDPNGYIGGVGIGVGQGAATRVPVLVDSGGYARISKSLVKTTRPSAAYTLSGDDCGSVINTASNVNAPPNLPIGCAVTIIPGADGVQIIGQSYTVINWPGGGGPSTTYSIPRAYQETTLRVLNNQYNETYYSVSRSEN